MVHRVSSASRRFTWRLMGSVFVTLVGVGLGRPVERQAHVTGKSPAPSVHTSQIFELAKFVGSTNHPGDSYPPTVKVALDNSDLDASRLLAFEENRFFVYAVGTPSGSGDSIQDGLEPAGNPRLVRRFIVLKPSIFVVDDEVFIPDSGVPVEWRLYSPKMPEVTGRRTRIIEGKDELFCETLLPKNVAHRLRRQSNAEPESERYVLEMASQGNSARTRFLHVLYAREGGQQGSEVHSELNATEGQLQLTVSAEHRIFRLNLPRANNGAGDIAISDADGKSLLDSRPLPSGILPHGPEGIRLLELFDADYRGGRHPLWDTGQPSGELKKVVEEGKIRPSRVVDLCCGSGTDAIYLANRGFDVTAIDIAPTALSQAWRKARKAGVSVRWLLADVLSPPNLKPFDFIYDRGCYHVVRDQNLVAYLDTVRRYSRPGTQFLLLTGNSNEPARDYGPPRVTEEEIRNDFLSLFDLEWLRESRFEINQPGAVSPLAWSVLLRRKSKP